MKKKIKKSSPAFRIAVTGIFSALALVISLLEKTVTAGLPLPPGVKPGLGNIAVMLVCFSFGISYALCIVVIKSGFMLLVSGVSAAFISLCGGLVSVIVMYFLHRLLKDRAGYLGISVIGAVFHNAGQMLAASILVRSAVYMTYAPVLGLAGVICGIITGIIMTFVAPAVSRAIK